MRRLILSLIMVIFIIITSGCSDDNNKTENNKSEQVSEMNKNIEQVQNKEIFVGNSDITGRDCYLLTDSIVHNKGDKSYNCKIKMVKSKDDVQYLEYRFFGVDIIQFRTSEGFSGIVSKTETPIEYNTIKYVKDINNEEMPEVYVKRENNVNQNTNQNINRNSNNNDTFYNNSDRLPSKISIFPSIGASMSEFVKYFGIEYEKYVGKYEYHIRFQNILNDNILYHVDADFNIMDIDEIGGNAPSCFIQIFDHFGSIGNLTENEIQKFIPSDAQIISRNIEDVDITKGEKKLTVIGKSNMLAKVYPNSEGNFVYSYHFKNPKEIHIVNIGMYYNPDQYVLSHRYKKWGE